MEPDSNTSAPPPSSDGRGDFFAVDRRAWAHVCRLGMNAGVAYLIIARGTGRDNRTSKWSVHAIERRTGISRSRGAAAITALEQAGHLVRDPTSRHDRPKFRIAPAHEVPGCEGYPPPALTAVQRKVLDRIQAGSTAVPERLGLSKDYDLWGSWRPCETADELVKLGWAVCLSEDKRRGARQGRSVPYRAVMLYDAVAAEKPDWIWLPNALIDGAAGETPPVELVRQTSSLPTLRLLVDLYGVHNLRDDGGIHMRRMRQEFQRHKVGEQGQFVVWGFVPSQPRAWADAPFVKPHLAQANGSEESRKAAWDNFWLCWGRLRDLGLIEFVGHLVNADSEEGEIIHPMALDDTGLPVEQEVCRMAEEAARALLTDGQQSRAAKQGCVALAPVPRHIEKVQMVGIARLRYRPRTGRTLAFTAREAEWRQVIGRLDRIGWGLLQ
jgi:hypothetical protein